MSTTIRDVAKHLKISITTVSRALDGYDDVSQETRDRVIKTAQKMGYSPNRAARQLRRQKAETVGFILPASAKRFDEPFFTEFISGLGEALSERNYDLLVANAKSDEQERNFYQRWVNSRKVDGFVLNRICKRDWRVEMLTKVRVPFSAMDESQDGVNYPCIRVDGTKGYTDLIQHISETGFTRISFIGGLADLIHHIDRLKWFKAALKKTGLPLYPELIISADMTSSGGYEAAKSLLSLPDPPDAIICINDETAFGVLHAAHEHALVIGRDIAIAGFDGVQAARHTEPPLTTLDIPVHDIARQLVQMLMTCLNNETLAEQEIKVQPKLLIRASSGG